VFRFHFGKIKGVDFWKSVYWFYLYYANAFLIKAKLNSNKVNNLKYLNASLNFLQPKIFSIS